MTKKVAFVGPIPPPLGGVAVMNLSFQEIELSNFENVRFNTSNQSQREDLYKNFPWKNILKEYKKSLKLKRFLREQRPVIINIFVTSGFSVLRDILFLRVLHRTKVPVIVHFHSKKQGVALPNQELSINTTGWKLGNQYLVAKIYSNGNTSPEVRSE